MGKCVGWVDWLLVRPVTSIRIHILAVKDLCANFLLIVSIDNRECLLLYIGQQMTKKVRNFRL